MYAKSCDMSFDYLKTIYLFMAQKNWMRVRHDVENVSSRRKNVRSESKIQPEQKPFSAYNSSLFWNKRQIDLIRHAPV